MEVDRDDLQELRDMASDTRPEAFELAQMAQYELDIAVPVLTAYEERFWRAFGELITERPSSMGGLCPIPVSKIRRYCEDNDYSTAQSVVFVNVMRIMDGVHRDAATKKANKSKSSK